MSLYVPEGGEMHAVSCTLRHCSLEAEAARMKRGVRLDLPAAQDIQLPPLNVIRPGTQDKSHAN